MQLDHQRNSSTKPTNIKFCYPFFEPIGGLCGNRFPMIFRPSWIRKKTIIPRSVWNIWRKKYNTYSIHGRVSSSHHSFGVKFSWRTSIEFLTKPVKIHGQIASPHQIAICTAHSSVSGRICGFPPPFRQEEEQKEIYVIL